MHDSAVPETRFGEDALQALRALLEARGARRLLVLTGPSRRFLGRVQTALAPVEIEVFDGAEAHVPAASVQAALDRLDACEPDALIALGGGAATGLGKMVRLERDLPFYVVPTTYAGSEMTAIHGVTEGATKRTGRDERARPDGVFYVPSLSSALSLPQKTKSLLNAAAHPISALSTGALSDDLRKEALALITQVVGAAHQLAETPRDEAAQIAALRAAARAGALLDRAPLGLHHRIAHALGGRFRVEHAGLHAVLLPHSVAGIRETDPELFAAIERAGRGADLEGQLFDLLVRVGAETSLEALGIDLERLERALDDAPELPRAVLRAAWHGRRPSARFRREDWGLREPVALFGPPLASADTVVIAVHGRSQTAEGILGRLLEISGHAPGVTGVAPQAPGNVWYPQSYREPADRIGPLKTALADLEQVAARVREAAPRARLVLFGFSQGACLSAEAAAGGPGRLDAVVAIAGARIGPSDGYEPPSRRLDGTPILLGVAERDPWVDRPDVEATAAWFDAAGARPEVLTEPGDRHFISPRQRLRAREILLGRPRGTLRGFGAHESEALPGALPRRQNSPRRAPYGLYAEQINQTGFVAARDLNKRSWTYRVRPAAQHGRFAALEGARVSADLATEVDPNLAGYAPLPLPEVPTDFVEGLVTFGGAGRPETRRGYAIHLYAANRSMHDRAFYDADGELLLVPESGGLVLLTEMGGLDLDPGSIAIVPRGVRFSVLLKDGGARGYVAEAYGRAFELPDRGPVGANGLTDERHFRAPEAWFEDRLAPGFEIVAKLGGRLWSARQDHSPFDVVAWHGNLAPRVYDLMDFSPVGNTRFDHPDPSIYTVLSAPLDERGSHTLDFVFFPPRWDVTEGTFRPPFFHRNATTEFNGIIADPSGDRFPFYAGGWFVTPSMTPHGVRSSAVERMYLMDEDPAPARSSARSMWFQLESALPIQLTEWGRRHAPRLDAWPEMWGTYRTWFDPR